MISFLKKVDEDGEQERAKFMGKGDILFLLAVGGLVGGFWYFSKSVKEETVTHFRTCDSLYTAEHYNEAEACYEASLDLGYSTDSLDSVGYHRRSQLETQREVEQTQFRTLDSLLRVGDSSGAVSVKSSLPRIYFLEGEQKELWESVQPPAPDSSSGDSLP